MKLSYVIPADTPAAACGRCFWFIDKLDKAGYGQCLFWEKSRYHNSKVCPDYEFDNDKITGARAC